MPESETAVTISGIAGVTVRGTFDIDRVSDTQVTVELTFDRNINTDGTLTFTVGAARAIVGGYNGSALTAQISGYRWSSTRTTATTRRCGWNPDAKCFNCGTVDRGNPRCKRYHAHAQWQNL